MKKNDIILIVFLLLTGALISFINWRDNRPGSIEENKAIIYVDSKPYMEIDLSVSKDYDIETEFGCNSIRVENGKLFISDADCSGKDCTKMGKICNKGEFICCIPHRLYICIEGNDSFVDTVTY